MPTREEIRQAALARRREEGEDRLIGIGAAPLLTLETIDPVRPTIRINGEEHHLRFYDDMSLSENRRAQKLFAEALQKMAQTKSDEALTDEDLDALSGDVDEAYRQMVRLVLPTCPAAVIARLDREQNMAIMESFFSAVADEKAEKAKRLVPRTGEMLSSPSQNATARESDTGSRRFPSAT